MFDLFSEVDKIKKVRCIYTYHDKALEEMRVKVV